MPHGADLARRVLNGRLYVMGGVNSNKPQVLMTEENGLSWSCKADLPAKRHDAASTVHEGEIWVVGGMLRRNAPYVEETASVIITYDAEEP